MSSNQTKKYIIRGFSQSFDTCSYQYSNTCSFFHLISANSFAQAVSRFQSKFDANFCVAWRFEVSVYDFISDSYSNDVLFSFFWNFSRCCFCSEDSLSQLSFKSI